MQKFFIIHRWKRVLAVLLAVITVIGLLPITAMADVGDTGGLNPGSPGGQRPNGTDVAWSTRQVARVRLAFLLCFHVLIILLFLTYKYRF